MVLGRKAEGELAFELVLEVEAEEAEILLSLELKEWQWDEGGVWNGNEVWALVEVGER